MNEWIENTAGKQPVADDVLVDVIIDNKHEEHNDGTPTERWNWKLEKFFDITHWRLHENLENSIPKSEEAPMKTENSWIANNGYAPSVHGVVEIVCKNGSKCIGYVSEFCWDDIGEDSITHWRELAKQSLETAYDVPPKAVKGKTYRSLTEALQDSLNKDFADKPEEYFKQPKTKKEGVVKLHFKKESPEEFVADIFNKLSGKNISVQDVVNIVNLYNAIIISKESYK